MYGDIHNRSGYDTEPIWPERVEYTYKVCEVDGRQYLISEMIHDKDNACWIAKDNLDEYLNNCKPEMLEQDFKELETKLKKQI